jgi:peptidoglycan DL-endopeptidase CwlO
MWMRRWLLLPITLIGVPMLGLMGLILTFVLLLSGGEDLSAAACTTTVDTGAQKVDHLDAAQTANASTIVQVGHQMAIPARGWVIAVATAMQESDLRNQTTATDHDSLGLFQQRPSQGWGTPAQLTDPVYAATKFYEHLTKVVGWQNRPLTEVAQAVQRSAFPNAYARHEAAATAVVKSLTGVDAAAAPAAGASAVPNPCPSPTDNQAALSVPSGQAGTMVQAALSRQGDPYVWGATGPDAFDCSGLVIWSWRQAKLAFTGRPTAADMYRLTNAVTGGSEQAGDLVFMAFGSRGLGANEPGHVAIVVSPGLLVEAPTEGVPVRVRKFNARSSAVRVGRLRAGALHAIGGVS